MANSPADARWSRIVDRYEASGKSIREFAAANDLNPRTLSWRRWQLRRGSASDGGGGGFVELEVVDPEPMPRSARTEPAPGRQESSGVVLSLDGYDASVLVDGDTDLGLLRRVLGALC